jgi:transposase
VDDIGRDRRADLAHPPRRPTMAANSRTRKEVEGRDDAPRGNTARRGRPTAFSLAIGEALIDLVLNEGLPIKHAARQLGIGVRTCYDWLERARCDGADPGLVAWAATFRRSLEQHRKKQRLSRSRRDREAARERWRRFKAARVAWWRNKLGEVEFWRRRRLWLAARGKDG